MKRPLKFPVSFDKGKRLITNKRTKKQADKAFKAYYAWLWENISESQRSILEKDIESARKAGWRHYYITLHRKKYVQMPRRFPRKKPKKKFDANKIPKVTKTPLDDQLSALFGYLKVTKTPAKTSK
jgi:hypothetical protein